MSINYLELSIGFVLGLIPWAIDRLTKPDLHITIANASNLSLSNGKYKSLNLKILNKRRHGVMKFFNKTATQLRCSITFYDFASKKQLFENKIIARWNTTREPLTPDYKQVDVGLALTNPREVLTPGEETTISVAIKKDGVSSCYPFNNESYLHKDFSKPEWEIKDDKFTVKVLLQPAESEDMSAEFLVLNKANLSQFKISKN